MFRVTAQNVLCAVDSVQSASLLHHKNLNFDIFYNKHPSLRTMLMMTSCPVTGVITDRLSDKYKSIFILKVSDLPNRLDYLIETVAKIRLQSLTHADNQRTPE